MGEPAGIGGELALRAWIALRTSGPAFIALDDPERLRRLAVQLGLSVPVEEIDRVDAGNFGAALPVLPIRLAVPAEPGQPNRANAAAVIESIERATRLALTGEVGAIVTNPINKSLLYEAGFSYPGHTEFLAALTGVSGQQVMMLASPALRVVPVTVHVSLRDSLAMLSAEMIIATTRITAAALRRDFGIAEPRLAIAGVNPHAGEDGALGNEESTIVQPAINALQAEGMAVSGPWPPDTMFTARARTQYDAAICMYHDQALIPLKTLDMDHGVNVTLGLPIARTSPDHGTAFNIAGQGIADPTSLISAICLAATLARK